MQLPGSGRAMPATGTLNVSRPPLDSEGGADMVPENTAADHMFVDDAAEKAAKKAAQDNLRAQKSAAKAEAKAKRAAARAERRANRRKPTIAVPNQGWRKWVWILVLRPLYWWLGFEFLQLPQSVKEQIGIEDKLVNQNYLTTGISVSVNGSKGGSAKTAISTAILTLLGFITNKTYLGFDGNPAGGNLHTRLGVGETHTAIEAVINPQSISDHATLTAKVMAHANRGLRNVLCVRHNSDSEQLDRLQREGSLPEWWGGTDNVEPPEERIAAALRHLRTLAHGMIVDQPNGFTSNWIRAAVSTVDVTLIGYLPWQENSAEDNRETLRSLVKRDPSVIDKCILVVCGYRGKVTQEALEGWSEYFGLPTTRICVIPFDPVFQPINAGRTWKIQPVRVVDPRQWKQRTKLAYLRLLNMIAAVRDGDAVPNPGTTQEVLERNDDEQPVD